METQEKTNDVYSIITNKIIDQLEKGTVPWRKPWTDGGIPRNMLSKKVYRGINVFLLGSLGYAYNLFITYKQIQEIGASIKENEKGHIIVFWNWVDEEKSDEENQIDIDSNSNKKPLLRYYKVYNISQLENVPIELIPKQEKRINDTIKSCEKIVANYSFKPVIKHEGNIACYAPHTDIITMPHRNTFDTSEFYYSTLFHELIHSTGHANRLNRKGVADYSILEHEAYSQEELVAEIGACFLSSYTGIVIKDFSNNIAYIQGWLSKLKDDKRFIIYASAQAQKATDWILGIEREY